MGKLDAFVITFSNPSGVFYAGTVLEGCVTVVLKDSMEMRGIRLTFEGGSHVSWTETRETGTGDNKSTEHVTYSASEKYFDQEVLLHGIWPSQGRSTTKLPEGVHTFPFQFHLPPGLPSSFEAGEGNIRYLIKCKIDKPWKHDHKTKRPFTIIGILDLNSDLTNSQRVQGIKEKRLCCLCCKSGPISVSFHLDQKGFVPGEVIRPMAEISNGSSRKMNKSFVELKMITTLYAEGSTHVTNKTVARLTRPSIEGHSEDVWSGEEIVIPPLPPSFLLGCKIIDVKYIVQLSVDPAGPAIDLKIPLDVVIGTIPLMSVVQQRPPMAPVGFDGVSSWPTVPSPDSGIAQYPPNMPPPSYNESITGRVSIKDTDDEYTHGDLSFAPSYTYYNWGRTPSAMPEPMGKQ
ncbi:hypothetical protein EGW08_019473 [Elysia chlorotica]|uniref:Arrestin C-terminal-like domain-containing protein n=1 Tax=Elysia chlorotica TaxID=188477 RepID=A0A3S0ZQ78_ELYCH|nr:hypothetical protein EGW08_019473 [Elysia chlorotica]